MNTMIMVFNIAVLVAALISAITYWSRRGEDRDALQALRETPSFRTLDEDERQALEPMRRTLQVNFVSGQVHRLSGSYARHGLSTNGGETMHDTIGGVEVLLPYDALSFLDVHNEAEVVVTAKLAIVVRLNDFHVVEGYKRHQEQHAKQSAWEAGHTMPASPAMAEMSAANAAQTGPQNTAAVEATDTNQTLGAVEILAQRKENAEEIDERRKEDKGFLPAVLWLASFLLLWFGSIGLFSWGLTLLLASIPVGLAMWLSRKPATQSERPGNVNQVRGPLTVVDTVSHKGNHDGTLLFLGDSEPLDMPGHWLLSGRIPFGEVLHMDIRTRDLRVLGLGKGWSLADEQRRFPKVRWHRNVTLLVVAVLGMFLAVLNSNGLAHDVPLAWHSVFSGETRTDNSAASLLQNPPHPGDRIQVQGQAYCELALTELTGSTEVVVLPDCSRVRWGAQPVNLPEVNLPEAIAKLGHPDFLEAINDPRAALAELVVPLGDDSLDAYLVRQNKPNMILFGLSDMIDSAEQACKAGLEDCHGLQRELVEALGARMNDGSNVALNTWPLLARELRNLAETDDDFVGMRASDVDALRSVAQRHANQYLLRKLQELAPHLLSMQQAGVVLIAPHDLQINTPQLPTYPSSTDISDLSEHWELARTFAANPVPFEINGLIIDRYEEAGGLRLEIDTSTVRDPAGESVINSLWFLLAALLACYHGVLLYLRLGQARKRAAALEEDLRQRPVPGAAVSI
ncbi:IgaA/UmoB family intracellular growth attenuator [Stenotrophomonas sp. Iso1]|uniref:IgaA/UmoB family intracellular growth attenuator n=1 Tax=Stenotrophomonas sp. Iso1 TaxID=2977283 RepID=UPI0022B77DEB|nr:IgaA/UmoB family intracellular growth attenuator [Stenotrophomonas sp. Iso1]